MTSYQNLVSKDLSITLFDNKAVDNAPNDTLVITRALDEALDVFGPLAKEAIFAALAQKFSSSISKYSIEQIEDSLVEILGNTGGKVLNERFREALAYTDRQ